MTAITQPGMHPTFKDIIQPGIQPGIQPTFQDIIQPGIQPTMQTGKCACRQVCLTTF
ncbi:MULTISPECIES: hypothetical protein [unclassified Anaerobiospirillum]|uniref:hypothetical protein n=1 Tax=unclassified Anaerobiospirillum TaxID=2647410 RepID=UPI001FF2DBB9|nr:MULTISPECIES: hypothetical protein [unclassified Anaerobiospirillum]MCK0535432.1 hypothetical protein [Anaerobiospirillum sp. NML120511]MCK0540851.1 hypothetical protein [Anaerobiospirillum sp. NML02-A-032]